MSPLLIVAIVAVAVVLTIRSARHSLADRDAVEAHHRTLDTLGEIAEHTTGASGYSGPTARRPHVRVVRPGGEEPNFYEPTEVPVIPPPMPSGIGYPAPNRADLVPPEPAAPLVAETIGPIGPDRPDAVRRRDSRPLAAGQRGRRVPASGPRPVGRRPPARHRRRRRARPAVVRLIGIVLIGLVALCAAVALNIGRSSPPPRRAAAAATPPRPAPTTTQLAAPVVLVSSDAQEARYRVAGTSADIEVVSASACWVQIRTGTSTGPVIFAGTLRPGDRRALPATGGAWVRLGNPPAVSIQVNGVPLATPPASPSQPYNLLFQPAPP